MASTSLAPSEPRLSEGSAMTWTSAIGRLSAEFRCSSGETEVVGSLMGASGE